jgi:DNA adenine methylase
VEPFAGSACLFFHLQPPEAILADLNEDLIRTYRTVRDNAPAVIESYGRLRRTKATYLRIRALDPVLLASAEAAARFLFLNRSCFNGLYRTNSRGEFNVPYAAPSPTVSTVARQVTEAAALLRSATLVSGDFQTTLAAVRRNDFVYLDPPYAVSSRRVFREYHQNAFAHGDLVRLAAALETLDRKGATFLVSYADCALARKLLSVWRLRRIRARRHIAGFAGHRRHAIELLATNLPLEAQP